MTPEQLIAMALEAGAGLSCIAEPLEHPWKFTQAELERFAALVAAAEREACAKVAMEFRRGAGNPVCGEVAAAIRQRGAA